MIALFRGLMATAAEDVRSQPLRTLISIAGLVAAIIAVIVVNSASQLSVTANREFIAREYGRPATVSVNGQVTHPLAIQTGSPSRESVAEEAPTWVQDSGPAQQITYQALDALRRNGVSAASVNNEVVVNVVTPGGTMDINALVVSPDYPDIRILEMQAGTFPRDTADGQTLHAVVNENFLARNNLTLSNAVGSTVAITNGSTSGLSQFPLQYVGQSTIVIDGVGSWPSSGSDMLIVSSIPRPELVQSSNISLLLHINANDVGLIDNLMRRWAGEQGIQIGDLQVRRVDMLQDLEPILDQQNVTAAAVSGVALAIGGLGVLGVGLANVRERAAEFGLRRALGASTVRIFFSSIVQTLLEVLIAILIAVPASALTVQLFARQLVLGTLPLPSETSVPISSVVIGVVAAIVVGLVAGLFPAIRAARMSVVQSLRDS